MAGTLISRGHSLGTKTLHTGVKDNDTDPNAIKYIRIRIGGLAGSKPIGGRDFCQEPEHIFVIKCVAH
jgi:hypothetical protein